MAIFENTFAQEAMQKLGWVLLHFVWQGATVALFLAILLRLFRKSSANVRYIISCAALGLIVLLPAITYNLVTVATPSTATFEYTPVERMKDESEAASVIVEMPVLTEPPLIERQVAVPTISFRQQAIGALEPALPYIVTAWLLGVFALSVWHLGGWRQLQRLKRRMVSQVDASLHSRLRELAELLGVRRAVKLLESALVQVPTVVGWLKPVILLPASALTGLSSEQLQAILAHELAHIRRHDYLLNILQTVIEILGFYHPAVFWISRKIRAERENCCDDLAVKVTGGHLRYARALTSMEEIRGRQPRLAVAATGGSLFDRIRRLVTKDSTTETRTGWAPSLISIVLILLLVISSSWILFAEDQKEQTLEQDNIQAYQINRSVTDFPEKEDFSTPEVAYVAINRVSAIGKNSGWARVSIKRLSEQFRAMGDEGEREPNPEWADVLKNAQILEVRIWNDKYAMVIAELPQEFSSKKIRSPIDLRSVEFENGCWLNAGNSRCWTLDEARSIFNDAVDYRKKKAEEELIRIEKYKQALDNHDEIIAAALELFENIRKADYEKILSYYEDGKWKRDGWKKLDLDYTVYTDWPSFALWICRTFKDNPITSVKLGEAFLSSEEIWDKKGFPTVPYRLTLADSGIITGELPFDYEFDEERWHPFHGIDWHLQDEPIKKSGEQVEIKGIRDKLEFRIVPNIDGDSEPKVSKRQFKKFCEDLNSYGHIVKIDGFEWFEIGTPENLLRHMPEKNGRVVLGPDIMQWYNKLPYQRLNEKVYILLSDKPEYKMHADGSWELSKVYNTTDSVGRPAVEFEFDEKGSELFYELTSNNLQNTLATLIQGKVVSALTVMSPLRKKSMIVGEFTQEYVEEIAETLRKGMPAILQGQQDAQKSDVQVEGEKAKGEFDATIQKRLESAIKLSNLGKALLIYANDHEEEYPDTLQDLRPYLEDGVEYEWILENIEYLGKGKSVMDPPDSVTAYDKALLKKGEGTNVLYNDCHVAFEEPEQLEKLGIVGAEIDIEVRFLLVPSDSNEIDTFFETEMPDWTVREDANFSTCSLDIEQFNRLLELQEEVPGTRMVASPLVRVRDRLKAEIAITEAIAYISGYDEPNSPLQEPKPKHDSVLKGIRLHVIPKIRPDNKKILLELEIELTEIEEMQKRMYKDTYPYEIPIVYKAAIATTVLISEGQTLALGGQKVKTQNESGQPIERKLIVLIKAGKVQAPASVMLSDSSDGP